MTFDVTLERTGDTVLVCPIGELDMATAPELERVLEGLAGEHVAVAMDLSGLTFVDCAGLRPVRVALRRGATLGRQVRLSSPSPAVRRVLEVTGLDEHLAQAG